MSAPPTLAYQRNNLGDFDRIHRDDDIGGVQPSGVPPGASLPRERVPFARRAVVFLDFAVVLAIAPGSMTYMTWTMLASDGVPAALNANTM